MSNSDWKSEQNAQVYVPLPSAPRSLPTHEIRSPEMQEVMSEIPGSILRWGLILLFGIVISILVVSWFIKYPDVVMAPVTLTTYNSPASLVARSGGIISRVFVKNEEQVEPGRPVALIGNLAQWNDILRLELFLDSIRVEDSWESMVSAAQVPCNLELGEVQSNYLRLVALSGQFSEYLQQAYIPKKIDILNKQINRQEEYIIEQKNQLLLSEEDLRLSVNSYRRDSNLFHRSSYSISVNEFEKSKQALIQKEIAFSNLKSNIKNNEASILKLKESLFDLGIQYEKELSKFRTDLTEALQILKVSIGQWKEKYLISSPAKGKITFTGFWNVNQVIRAGDLFATVIPDDPERIIVRAKVPVSGSGKVKANQEVNIKLSGFPYMEFGVIKGRINSVSMVPVEDSYIAEINLTEGMRSTYNQEIRFINEMTGTAEIITENKRLIYKFIKPLNAINKGL